jgi:hypothetical protein
MSHVHRLFTTVVAWLPYYFDLQNRLYSLKDLVHLQPTFIIEKCLCQPTPNTLSNSLFSFAWNARWVTAHTDHVYKCTPIHKCTVLLFLDFFNFFHCIIHCIIFTLLRKNSTKCDYEKYWWNPLHSSLLSKHVEEVRYATTFGVTLFNVTEMVICSK